MVQVNVDLSGNAKKHLKRLCLEADLSQPQVIELLLWGDEMLHEINKKLLKERKNHDETNDSPRNP